MESLFKNKRLVPLLALTACILWGSAFPVLKISYAELNMTPLDYDSKIVFAGMRFFLASLMLAGMTVIIFKQSMRITLKEMISLLVLGLLQTALQYTFFYNGLANTSGMKGAILASAGTFIVVILAHFIYKNDRLSINKIIGLIAGLIGIIMVNWGKELGFDFKFNGEGFLLIAALVSSIGTFLAKSVSKEMHPFVVTTWQMFLGSIVLLSFGIPRLGGKTLDFTPKTTILFVYAAFLSAAAFAIWYSLLKYHKAGEVSMYKFMIPVSGSILSIVFLGENTITWNIILALIFVAVGIIIINKKPSRKKLGE